MRHAEDTYEAGMGGGTCATMVARVIPPAACLNSCRNATPTCAQSPLPHRRRRHASPKHAVALRRPITALGPCRHRWAQVIGRDSLPGPLPPPSFSSHPPPPLPRTPTPALPTRRPPHRAAAVPPPPPQVPCAVAAPCTARLQRRVFASNVRVLDAVKDAIQRLYTCAVACCSRDCRAHQQAASGAGHQPLAGVAHEVADVQRRRVLLLSQRSGKVSRRWRRAVPSVIQVAGLGDVEEIPVAVQRRPDATNDGEGEDRQVDDSPGPARAALPIRSKCGGRIYYCSIQAAATNTWALSALRNHHCSG